MNEATPRRGVSWDMRGGEHRSRRRLVAAAAAGLTLLAMAAPAAMATTLTSSDGPLLPVLVEYTPAGTATAANAAGVAATTTATLGLLDSVLPPGLATTTFATTGAVAVSLPQQWIDTLEADGATVSPNTHGDLFQSTSPSGATCPSATTYSPPTGYFPTDTGANRLASAGDTGQGTTVAILDTGINGSLPDFAGRLIGGVDLSGSSNQTSSPFTDQYGHGTFVAGLVAGNGASSNGQYVGEAPGADLVSIKVAGASGATSISTIIQGIDWAVKNQKKYGIDVLNLSLGAMPTGPTATEPMDQAVEYAWNSGITVVVAAGNSGPFNGTITSPGDDPLVITAGAFADNNSPAPANWAACPFSSVGPTEYDGWLKPDLVAPGRSVVSLLDPGSTIATDYPQAVVGTANFVGSGTSFSAAITSGAAALVLSANPGISPDAIKGRLLGNAMPGELGSPFVEGHGFLNAYDAATGPPMVYNQGPAALAESSTVPSTVSLPSAWAPSSWNPANWTGSAWDGSAWDGSSWTSGPWNGSSWTGSAWDGSAWDGSSWNGSSWTGSSWTGSAWDGSSWTGSAWDGSSWTGMAWDGSAWDGSAWDGSAWDGSSWTGSSWTGSSWTGSSWTGSSWTGSSWTGDLWA
ncbi:MAG: S8 family serine peptidase [Acidimicrobiales bacterium]